MPGCGISGIWGLTEEYSLSWQPRSRRSKSELVHDADWETEKRHSGTAGFLLLSLWNDATMFRVDLPPKDSSLETLAIMQRYDS